LKSPADRFQYLNWFSTFKWFRTRWTQYLRRSVIELGSNTMAASIRQPFDDLIILIIVSSCTLCPIVSWVLFYLFLLYLLICPNIHIQLYMSVLENYIQSCGFTIHFSLPSNSCADLFWWLLFWFTTIIQHTQFSSPHIKTMIWPYLGSYWSVWPHLLLDISPFLSCVSINRSFLLYFGGFVLLFVDELPNHDLAVSRLVLVRLTPSFAWYLSVCILRVDWCAGNAKGAARFCCILMVFYCYLCMLYYSAVCWECICIWCNNTINAAQSCLPRITE
jgi:hypothetical protein